jgi:hypothetical protein
MLFTVEVPLAGNLAEQMNNMRTWLDHKHSGAIAFRRVPGGWHIDFESERDAREFVRAFYGRMLSPA